MFNYPSPDELAKLRKGIRKRKLPKLSSEMMGQSPTFGYFEILENSDGFQLKWLIGSIDRNAAANTAFFQDLSFDDSLSAQRYEVGMLISSLFDEYGTQIRREIPGPHEAMQESEPYFREAEKWEHWAIVPAGYFLK